MKKSNVESKAITGLPYSDLLEKMRAALYVWNGANSAIQAGLVNAEGKGQVMDPFALLQAIADVRSNVNLLAQVGESSVADAEAWAFKEAQAATLAFDGEIRKFCSEGAVSISGRFPSYVLEGFLTVRLSPNDRTCAIGGKKLKTLLASRVWPDIAVAIKEEKLRGIDPAKFLDSCLAAYKRSLALRNAKLGDSIPLKDLFRELVFVLQLDKFWRSPLRQNFVEYTEDYFSRDLSKIMATGNFTARDGAKMELMPTAFAKDGFPIIVGEGVRYIGHVSFGGVVE